MPNRTCLAIVLAAGEGTRMRSARPKVLHTVAGAVTLTSQEQAIAEKMVNASGQRGPFLKLDATLIAVARAEVLIRDQKTKGVFRCARH